MTDQVVSMQHHRVYTEWLQSPNTMPNLGFWFDHHQIQVLSSGSALVQHNWYYMSMMFTITELRFL